VRSDSLKLSTIITPTLSPSVINGTAQYDRIPLDVGLFETKLKFRMEVVPNNSFLMLKNPAMMAFVQVK